MKINRNEILGIITDAATKMVPSQEAIDTLVDNWEKIETVVNAEIDKKMEIINIFAKNLEKSYRDSLEEIRKRNEQTKETQKK